MASTPHLPSRYSLPLRNVLPPHVVAALDIVRAGTFVATMRSVTTHQNNAVRHLRDVPVVAAQSLAPRGRRAESRRPSRRDAALVNAAFIILSA